MPLEFLAALAAARLGGRAAEFQIPGDADSEATEFRPNFSGRNDHAGMRRGVARRTHRHLSRRWWLLAEQQ
jgi:hypothetical protein